MEKLKRYDCKVQAKSKLDVFCNMLHLYTALAPHGSRGFQVRVISNNVLLCFIA